MYSTNGDKGGTKTKTLQVHQEQPDILQSTDGREVKYLHPDTNVWTSYDPPLLHDAKPATTLVQPTIDGKAAPTTVEIAKADAPDILGKEIQYLHPETKEWMSYDPPIFHNTQVIDGSLVKRKEVQLQKWKILQNTRDYSNGEIVIDAEPPTDKCRICHAFTAHSTIGETARGKVFIDRRNLFEIEHWETIIGRARRWEDIVIIDLPDPTAADIWASTIFYSMSSKIGNCQYIGLATGKTPAMALEKRKEGHKQAFKSQKNECKSSIVMQFKDWQMDIIEEFPCATRSQAEARENYHIQRADNAVNVSIRRGVILEPCSRKRQIEVEPVQVQEVHVKAAQAFEPLIEPVKTTDELVPPEVARYRAILARQRLEDKK